MIYVPLIVFCVVFFELFVRLHIGSDAAAIITRSRESMRVLKSTEIEDDEKELLMRKASADTSKATLRFGAKFLAIGAVLYALFEIYVDLLPGFKEPLVHSLVSPSVIVALTAITAGYAWARGKIVVRSSR